MADDLVQRLRNGRLCRCLEAACEIERLRAEVATIRESRTVAERELAALRERIEKAPIADPAENALNNGESLMICGAEAGYYRGRRVRLLVEEN